MSSRFPIVLIGLHSEVGQPIADGLRKDGYDIIRQIQSVDAAKADLPYVLSGKEPPNAPTNDVGSGNYSQPARAVLCGRGFTQGDATELRNLFDKDAAEPVLWAVGADANKPNTGNNDNMPPPGAIKVIEDTMRRILKTWVEKGAKEGELVLY